MIVVCCCYFIGLGPTVSEVDDVSVLFFTGLGPTVSELDVSECPVFPKMKFSMMIPEVKEHLKQYPGKPEHFFTMFCMPYFIRQISI